MPKVSVNILTKNRAELLKKALASVARQNFKNFEVVVVNDGSTDETQGLLDGSTLQSLNIINHVSSLGITQSRQEALSQSRGEYIAILDDDDEWTDADKLKKQVAFLENHPEVVLVGGGIKTGSGIKLRPESDGEIRRTMLFRNNFFTSTVMFRREAALKAGGFRKDSDDLAEDYDLWLRLGKIGQMYNFQEVFAAYRVPNYNKPRYRAFLAKQLRLIGRHGQGYPYGQMAKIVMKLRLLF